MAVTAYIKIAAVKIVERLEKRRKKKKKKNVDT